MNDMIKTALIAAVTAAVVFVGASFLVGDNQSETFGGGTRFPSGISADSTAPSSGEVRGTTLTTTGAATIGGTLTTSGAFNPSAITFPNQSISTTSDTLVAGDLGDIVFLNTASGTTITLPAATAGATFKFILKTLFDTANIILDSAEGDNIEGVIDVGSSLISCAAEDQINFVSSAETLGDYVEIASDGTSWFITGGAASSTGGITCTDPS